MSPQRATMARPWAQFDPLASDEGGRLWLLFTGALALLLFGYALFDRAFAWIHVPSTPLFAGEVVLALGIAAFIAAAQRPSLLTGPSRPLRWLVLYMGWGLAVLVVGVGTFSIDALRDSAIWYYGMFAILIASSALVRPLEWWVERYALAIPFILLWLPFAVVLGALWGQSGPTVPDGLVSVFSHNTPNIAIHAALALGFLWTIGFRFNRLRRWRIPLSILCFTLIIVVAVVSRTAILAVAVGGLVLFLGMPERRHRLVWLSVGFIVVVGSAAFLLRVEISLFDNNRDISPAQLAENVISILAPDRLTTEEQGENLVSNREWRTGFWGQVADDVTRDRPLAGFGFGPNLRERYDLQDEEVPARSVHSSHVNVLARMGWVGALLWLGLWSSWFHALGRTRTRLVADGLETAAGLALILMMGAAMFLVNGVFNEVAEGPQGAIWLWSIFGLGVVLDLAANSRVRQPT